MDNLSNYRGISQFGCAYQKMLGNDTHAPGSVDWVLWERLIRLCTETAGYLYKEYTPTQVRYEKGSRPTLESYLKESVGDCGSDEDKIKGIVRFTQRLGQNVVDESLDEMRFGGTEEEIIQRGSDWCTGVARVGCVLSQVAGIPARLINLFNTNQAYSGHVITEVYRGGVWGAVDPTTAVIYRKPNGIPASTWELMNQPQLIEVSSRGESTPYTTEGQFRAAGVSNYFIWEWKDFDYTVSSINDYYRSILEMSAQEWPAGLRWLHDEDVA